MFSSLRTALVALTLVYSVSTAHAADFEKGMAAAQARDFMTALQEWRPLAEQGNASAQFNLGRLYNFGLGVDENRSEAVRWYRLAAEQGNASAQDHLGRMYDDGNGVLKSYTEAASWYRLAAEQNNASAQNNLGLMYEYGNGVLKDKVLAHMWYNLAGANGYRIAAENRDNIETIITLEQIAEAMQLARSCKESNYQGCD